MKIPIVEAIVPPHVTDCCYRAVAMDESFLESSVHGAMWIEIAQIPFAEDAGAIPIGGKHVGHGGRFPGNQIARKFVGAEPHMPTMSSCQQSRPGGSAHRGDVKIGQPDTFGMQLVQVRCLEPGMPIFQPLPRCFFVRNWRMKESFVPKQQPGRLYCDPNGRIPSRNTPKCDRGLPTGKACGLGSAILEDCQLYDQDQQPARAGRRLPSGRSYRLAALPL